MRNVLVRQPLPESPPEALSLAALHPVFVAAFAPLALYAHDPIRTAAWELFAALGLSLTVAVVLTVVLRRFYGNWRRAALGASWLIFAVYAFWLSDKVNGTLAWAGVAYYCSKPMLLALWSIIALAGMTWFFRDRKDDSEFSKLVSVFSLAVLMGPLGFIGWNYVQSPDNTLETPLPEASAIDIVAPEDQPDIYYLVVDRYPSADVLRRDFQFDNGPFLRALQQRGFVIGSNSQTNYPDTALSLTSTLNLNYLPENASPTAPCGEGLQNHRVGKLLTQHGYRYYHLGGACDGVRSNRQASFNYSFSPVTSDYTQNLLNLTPLRVLAPGVNVRKQTHQKLNLLPVIAKAEGAKFVLAYFDALGAPWEFDVKAASRTTQQNYINEVAYLNKHLLAAIDQIQAQSRNNPLIIIQSTQGADVAALQPTDPQRRLQSRCSILTAIAAPHKKLDRAQVQRLSPVNTFRLVLAEYFSADTPPLANHTYYWSASDAHGSPVADRGCQFVDITDQVHGAAGAVANTH